MTKVKLHGKLRERFGTEYDFDIITPMDAVSALKANFPDFMEHMIQNSEPGYYIFVDGKSLTPEGLMKPAGSRTIHFVPVIKGAKKSPIWTIVIGVALIAIGGPLGLLGQGALATAAVGMGVSLLLQGITALIAGTPDGGPQEGADTAPSTFFSGPVNTIQQGGPVPIIYGEVLSGSQVISAGVKTFARGSTGSNAPDLDNCINLPGSGVFACVAP